MANWSRVQVFFQNAQFNFSGPYTNTSKALTSPVAVGDTICLITSTGGNTTTYSPTVTDQLGNTYTRLTTGQGGQLYDTVNDQSTDAWWCIVTVAGTPTITYKPHTVQKNWIGFKGSHFTGSDAASTRRDSKGALQTNPGTSANAIASPSAAASTDDLLWGGSGNPGSSFTTEAAGSGFTGSSLDATTSLIDEWKTATGAGAVTFTDATNGAASVYMTFAIAIAPATPASPPPAPARLNAGIGGDVINAVAVNAAPPTNVSVSVSPTGVQATAAVGTVTVLAGSYPRTISADSHWILNGDGTVFNMNGDAGWGVANNITGSDATTYFADRKAKGVNLVMFSLIEHKFTEQTPKWRNKNGDDPFTGTVSAGNPDFTTPNEAFWAHIDFIFSEAAKYGITLMALPAYVGFDDGGTQDEGWATVISANGTSRMTTYGTFLGNRYKNTPNLIWCMGGDCGPICTVGNLTTHINNLANAIKAADPNHLMSAHPSSGHQSVTDYNQTWLDINAAYADDTAGLSTTVKNAYQNSPTRPTFMIEADYGNEHSMTSILLRTQMYQSVLGGGVGHIYGQSPTWYFGVNGSASGNAFADTGGLDWHTQLSTFGANFLPFVAALQGSRPMSTLTPDYSHVKVTAGYGTLGTVTYAEVAATNRILVAYTSGSALTVDKTQFVSATFNVRWFNPRTGNTTNSGTAAFGSSTQVFTPPDANDWVLLLDDQALALPDPQAPSVTISVTGVQATGAVGTVTVRANANMVPTGVQATAAVGTVVVMAGARPDAVTGVQATSGVGTVTVVAEARAPPTGAQATSAVGNPSVRADGNEWTITGVEADGAVGIVSTLAGARPPVTGVQITGAVGSTTQQCNSNSNPSGTGCTGAVGTVGPHGQANVAVTGVEADGAVGTVTITIVNSGNSATINATGVQATSAVGTVGVRADANESGTGVGATTGTGTPSIVGRANTYPNGVEADGAVGTLTVFNSHIIPVTGVQATAAVGTVFVGLGIIVKPTGVQATGAVGTITSVRGAAGPNLNGVQGVAAVGSVSVIAIDNTPIPEITRRISPYIKERIRQTRAGKGFFKLKND